MLQVHCWKHLCNSQRLFQIVRIGQDHLWGSLYVIEISLIDLVPELGHLFGSFCFGYFGLTTLLHWGESGKQSFCLAQRSHYVCAMSWKCLVITPFGRLNCKYCLHLVTLGFATIIRHTYFQIFNLVHKMFNSFCIDFQVSIATLLKNPSRLTRDIQEQSI